MPEETERKNTKEQVKALTEKLETGIKDVFRSGKYTAYLQTMAKFHNYSVNNTMLIHLQKPNASLVAGFNAWQKKFERSVMKGEKGIKILAPVPYKQTVPVHVFDREMRPVLDENGNQVVKMEEFTLTGYRPVTVFDVSQTDGKPLPEIAESLNGKVKNFAAFKETLKRVSPVPILFQDIPQNIDGYFSPDLQHIVIREGMGEVQTVCAMVHEMTHATLHDWNKEKEVRKKTKRTMEVEAESVAFVVCANYGIETGSNSFGYIASWAGNKGVCELRESLETIRETSAKLITEIDSRYLEVIHSREEFMGIPSVAEILERKTPVLERLKHCKDMAESQKRIEAPEQGKGAR